MKNIIVFIIKIYRVTLSKMLVFLFGDGCRFYPTCSQYAIEAVSKHGVFKGLGLAIKRFSRCHPYSKEAHIDLVPKN